MAGLAIDVGEITEGLNDFLHQELGVDLSFDLEGMLADLVNAEQMMHDLTGGDITDIFGAVIDESLQDGGVIATGIQEAVETINQAHQAPYMVAGVVSEPFQRLKNELAELMRHPDLDMAALSVDYTMDSDLAGALAPFSITMPRP